MARSRTKAPRRAQAPKGKARKSVARPKAKATVRRSKTAGKKSKKANAPKKAAKVAKARVVKRAGSARKAPARAAAKAPAPPKPRTAAAQKAAAAKRPGRAPTLDRERRRATDPDLVPTPPSSLDLDRSASAARSGRAELAHKIHEHTSTGPALTAGDVDADWESADSVGDEAPGGDNPTPDQDVVDEIGRSLGVEYDDDEELQGGAEIGERDRKRWELDPASSDDFDEREK
jgi:uncharacterized protein DUF6335